MKNNDKTLIIVESPAKIKTISKFLGPDFKIVSTFGHIKDLPEDKIGVEIDKNGIVKLEYKPLKGKSSVIADICKQAASATEILLGSDNDREGEVISWHIDQEIKKNTKTKKTFRITFNEITKSALEKAISEKTDIDMDKVQAQQARRVVDRWVGYEVSPILWRKISKGLSAGRVQSAVLLLVCQREREIKAFVPEESWSILANMLSEKGPLNAELFKVGGKSIKIKDKATADKIVEQIKLVKNFSVSQVTDKERLKNPMPPFMTSTLQQDAFNKLNFSVDKTMLIAQKLYEGLPLADPSSPQAFITYMRSDSLRLSDAFLKEAKAYINKEHGKDYLPSKTIVYEKKGAQDAHEAIRPITLSVTPEIAKKYLEKDIAKLYELIWRRSVACQMAPAKFSQRQILINGDDLVFKASGSTLLFDGFLKTYRPEEESSESEKENEEKSETLPNLGQNDQVKIKKVTPKQHFTQPPPHYTQASLVKEMEKLGIGRPSTYSNTISTILKREYVTVDKKKFFPTELGIAVTDILSKNLPDIVDVTFTAKMEEDLDKIAAGQENKDEVLLAFYKKFQKELESFKKSSGEGKESIMTDLDCPECKKNKLAIKFSRMGQFVGCSAYPKCTFTSNFTRDEQDNIKLVEKTNTAVKLDKKCPECKKDLVERMGRFGPFVSCSGFPKCKYIEQQKMKTPCPDCGKEVTRRVWRKGTMWGCSGYPKCKFAIFGDIEETPCPKCKKPYLLISKNQATGEAKLVCQDQKCAYSRPFSED